MDTQTLLIDRLNVLINTLTQDRFGNDSLWTLGDVADYLRYKEDHARRIIHRTPDFPKPIQISDGYRRWIAREIKEWAESRRSTAALRKVGRPRNLT